MPIRTVCLISLLMAPMVADAQLPDDSPRMSPLVRVIAKVEPAVVALFIPAADNPQHFSSGSATIVHADGYAITNNHVVTGESGYAVLRGKPVRFRVVGRSPEKDLAVIRLRDHQGELPVVPMGHSHDVMNGEMVAVVGNPGGRGTTVTSGIVSSKGTQLSAPSALWATQHDSRFRDDYIQYDAATNRGNSGGALINMDGELIGVVAALIPTEQNSSFAIPIDRVRLLLERIVEPELMHQRHVGVQLNPLADWAIITAVDSDSPAQQAGIHTGDVITKVNGRQLKNPADWLWMLNETLPHGKSINLIVRREKESLPIELTPRKLAAMQSSNPPADESQIEPGLDFAFYDGKFKLLPEFEKLTVSRSGTVETIDLEQIQGDQEDYFAVRLSGFLKIDQAGLYRLSLTSDDGSRLWLNDELFIDHDGNHPAMTLSRLARMAPGLHPLEIEYFEGYGANVLELKLERIDGEASGETTPLFKRAVP
ncbi:trypsin-like peptidase domain-containing protein [Allorhodopirellula heiligendammensis]|uniref:Periplasmic serine endoprotease DegP n=1 Tax=Allorhodopirellula heiligendammensis TaxID=2714739 RepID=A0A5C6BTG8_9BACT|nr:trypsin-like peptidase domain-containing protein [Allorhodopirellula heiligendammensis]TWU15318.1 Periplasmic serine endoprotease DegP precursor [Allorhodopirellula heiligendammensis]